MIVSPDFRCWRAYLLIKNMEWMFVSNVLIH